MAAPAKAIVTVVVAAAVVLLIFLVLGPRIDDSERRAEDSARLLEKFRALPYATFGDDVVDPAESGVILHDPSKTCPGYNFYASKLVSSAWLMDMAGTTVHEWVGEGPGKLVYAIMLANGDILMLYRMGGLERLDWNSNRLWRKPILVHHDVSELPDGSFYTISVETVRYRGLLGRFPVLLRLSAGGEELDRWSSREHMDEIMRVFDTRSFLDTVIDSLLAETDSVRMYKKLKMPARGEGKGAAREKKFDYFHANTVGVLPATPVGLADNRFRAGNLITCFRNVNQIAVLDAETWEVLWAWGEGELQRPHQPTMLEDGNILIFDNGVERGYSRILELNPLTGKIEWQFTGDPPESFYSKSEGSCQRLPNGNTLICESTKGRVFEVTRSGETVWEWLNPETKDGRRGRVYRMLRLPPEVVDPLLEGRAAPGT